jgi:hypothetical protein
VSAAKTIRQTHIADRCPGAPQPEDPAAVVPPPALTEEGQLRARVQVLEEDLQRSNGLAKVGARCMREGHQGQIESGRVAIGGHRFALAVRLGLGTDASWDAIYERVAVLPAPTGQAAVRAAALRDAADTADRLSMKIEQALRVREVGPLTALQDLADELRRLAGAQPAPPAPVDWRSLLRGFQALLDAYPTDLQEGGPAVRPRPLPAGLVARWRDTVHAAREQHANETTKEN